MATYQTPSLDFAVYDLCKTAILSAEYEAHIWDVHIIRHRVKHCLGCRGIEVVERIRHITKEHYNCPLCNDELFKEDYIDHFILFHHFNMFEKNFEDCWDRDLPHFLTQHHWNVCSCKRHIAQDRFFEHLQREHVQEHRQIECSCGKKVQQQLFGLHMEHSHGWVSCKYCNHAEEKDDKLDAHEKSNHCFFYCTERTTECSSLRNTWLEALSMVSDIIPRG